MLLLSRKLCFINNSQYLTLKDKFELYSVTIYFYLKYTGVKVNLPKDK